MTQHKADSADSSSQGSSSSNCRATEDHTHQIPSSSKQQSATAQCDETNKNNPNPELNPVDRKNEVEKSTVLSQILVSVLPTKNDGLSEKSEMSQENVIEVPKSKLSDEPTLSSTSYNMSEVPLNAAEPHLSVYEAISNNGKKRKISEEKSIDSLVQEHTDEQTVAHNLNNKRIKVKTQSNEQKRNLGEADWSSDSEDDVLTKKIKTKQNEKTTEVKETVLISEAMENIVNDLPPQVFVNQKDVHETKNRENLSSTSEKVFKKQNSPAGNIVKEVQCSVSTTELLNSNKEHMRIRIMEVNQTSFSSKESGPGHEGSSKDIDQSFKDAVINRKELSNEDSHLQLKELKAAAEKSPPNTIQEKQAKEKPISSMKVQSIAKQSNITKAKQIKNLSSEVSPDVTSSASFVNQESDNDSVKKEHVLPKELVQKPMSGSLETQIDPTERETTTCNNEDKGLVESKNITGSKKSVTSNCVSPRAVETSLLLTNKMENVPNKCSKIGKSVSSYSSLPEESSTSKLPEQTKVKECTVHNVEPSTSKGKFYKIKKFIKKF